MFSIYHLLIIPDFHPQQEPLQLALVWYLLQILHHVEATLPHQTSQSRHVERVSSLVCMMQER